MLIAILLVAVFWLAWTNGANDNFKGVATLYGSATCGYRPGLAWATVATVSGGLVSVFLAQTLIKAFSGKGLIPDPLLDSPMLAAIGASGVVTILLATFLGMPTSTTHARPGRWWVLRSRQIRTVSTGTCFPSRSPSRSC